MLLFSASVTFAGAVTINSVCEFGTCGSPDVLTLGGATSINQTFTFTFANTDEYSVSVTFSASESASCCALTGGVTFGSAIYLGNSTHSASAADTLIVDILQNYTYVSGGSGTFNEEGVIVTLGGGIAAGSSLTFNQLVGGNSLGILGPVPGPGSAIIPGNTGVALAGLPNPLLIDWRYTDAFAAGSTAGAFIAGPVPEPASLVMTAASLIGLSLFLALRTPRR